MGTRLDMKYEDARKMFVKWIKATSWHPCGLDHVLRDCGGEFVEPVENMYQAYAAGIRKGMRIQKERQNASKL